MASIVISGDTSGAVTISAPAIAGTTTLTLPTTSGTIVTTAGATSLTTSGNLTFTGTGNRILGDMSNGTLSNRFAFQTSTTNGNTSVQVIPNGTGNTSNFRVFNSSDPNNAAYLSLQAGAAEAIINSTAIGTGTSLPLTIYTAGIERLRIDTSGNVGIGTSSTVARFEVSGGQSRFSNDVYLTRNDASGPFFGSLNNVPLRLGTNDTERMRITSAGRVGISNSSPEYLLNVGSSSSIASLAGVGLTLFASGGLTSSIGGVLNFRPALGTDISKIFNLSICAYDHSGDGNADGLSINGSDGISFCTGGDSRNERMRIDGSGNVLIGTTSQNLGGRVFNVFTPNNVCGSFYRGTSNNDDEVLEVRSNVSSTNNLRFRVLASGNVQNSNNSYGGISDVKLKENIVDANPKLEKLNQVRVVTYNLKGDTTKQIGVVAQELEQVFPSLVEEVIDRDEDGNDLGTATKSVKYSVFVPMLIKAIQELNAKVEAQAAEIAALKGAN